MENNVILVDFIFLKNWRNRIESKRRESHFPAVAWQWPTKGPLLLLKVFFHSLFSLILSFPPIPVAFTQPLISSISTPPHSLSSSSSSEISGLELLTMNSLQWFNGGLNIEKQERDYGVNAFKCRKLNFLFGKPLFFLIVFFKPKRRKKNYFVSTLFLLILFTSNFLST